MSTDSEQRIELYFPSGVFEDVNATSNRIRAQTELDAKLDPLARFFTHAPDVKTLTIEQLPAPGEDGFPDTEVAARVLQFATDDQYLLYNVAGAYYDEYLEWMVIYKFNSQKLSAFFISLPHVAHDRSFLCLVDPAGQDVSPPQNGERCKTFISNVKIPTSKNLLKEHGHRLAGVITESLAERHRLSYVNKEADYFFGRQMSQDELNEVVPNSSESDQPDRAKWLERVLLSQFGRTQATETTALVA
ncbi:hypothetical protein LRP88_10066 [Fusarium phalaenopsidis]